MSASRPAPLGGAARAFVLPASVLLLLLVWGQRADPDLWGRLSAGAVLFETGGVARVDDFSYTAVGRPWVDHEWGSGAVFYALLQWLGEPGLVLFKYACAAATLALVFAAHRVHGVSPAWAAGALTLLAPAVVTGFLSTVRAQVFSLLLFAGVLWLLERVRCGRGPERSLLWLVPLSVVWGNLHGGYAIGAVAVLLYAAADVVEGRPRRASLGVGAVAVGIAALGLANPYGPAYLEFLLHAWTLDRTGITEWRPLLEGPWTAGNLYLLALAVCGGSLAGLAGLRAVRERIGRAPGGDERIALGPTLVLLQGVAMTLMARRIHPFLALTLAVVAPLLLPSLLRKRAPEAVRRFGRWLPAVAAAGAAALLALAFPARPLLRSWLPDERARSLPERARFPEGAVRYLRASPYEGRLLNPFTAGQFLYWALYPRFRVAMDGRYEEVYAQQQFLWVHGFYRERDPERLLALARGRADFVLFRSSSESLRALAERRAWRLLYDDGVFALLGHRSVVGDGRVFRFRPPADRPRASIADYFTLADRARFGAYPRSRSAGERDN